QGPVGDEFGEWGPAEYEAEFWLGDRQQLGQRDQTVSDLQDINDRRVKRDALRTLRGQILRTELYAMDGMSREDRPYTVTESLFGIREESEPGTTTNDEGRRRIFFPHPLAQRTTQLERGDEPMTQFTFTDYRGEN